MCYGASPLNQADATGMRVRWSAVIIKNQITQRNGRTADDRRESFANPTRRLTTHPGASFHVGADRDAGMPGTRVAD